ncbi:hypothetical protein BGZ60DRAFT_533508 [Tricladium varicosporioides]|nr:hypothetical protein BGZ60DRAFT_533508 [Hymenoscyphus varicosporioides]
MEQNIPRKEVRKRSRAACDACRERKVKCVYDGSICQACIELKVACTQNKPRKRRGPESSYANRQRQSMISTSLPESPQTANTDVLGELGPPSLIRQIIDDWFSLIHSVAPLLHRGQFLSRLENGETAHDPEFCGLVISICAATVASLKRKSCTNYGEVTVEKCSEVISRNRLLEGKEKMTLEWCQAKYNLSTAIGSERGMDTSDPFRFIGEASLGVKYLLYHEVAGMELLRRELLKRLYWLIFAGICTLDMYRRPSFGLLSPNDNLEQLRPLDLVDSQLDPITAQDHTPWHGDTMSYIPGLNFLSDLFLIWHSSQQTHNRTLLGIQHHIDLVSRALDGLPTELRWRGGLSRPPRSNFGTDVQVANLYITQLHIRSNLLEQLGELKESQDLIPAREESSARQGIIDDLLEILSHMSRETLEANGHCLGPKIRDIGSALLDEVRVGERNGNVSEKARRDLLALLEKLETLDFRPELGYASPI